MRRLHPGPGAAALLTLLGGCLVVETDYTQLPPGPYRGVFLLDGRQSERVDADDVVANDLRLEDVRRDELPFNFEVAYAPDSAMYLELINGTERIRVDDIAFERLYDVARDSVTIRFPLNDAYFTGYHEEGVLEGYYVDETRDGGDYRIPLLAQHGLAHRFTQLRKEPAADYSGRWAVTFGVQEGEDPYPAVAELRQEGNRLTGTFQTETGDYRYLEGTAQAERLYLSVFDGTHIFLFTAKEQPDGTLLGIFRSGTHYQTLWEARRDADAELADATSLTRVLDPESSVAIEGIDASTGQRVRIGADAPAEALRVVSLFGSWCPNCADEARYLDSLRAHLDPERVRVYGAAFEKMRDTTRALAAVRRFGERLDLGYPLVLVSTSGDKAEATATLGFLDRVRSFPTLLVLDGDNRVVYVHQGFAGPATSAYGPFARAFAKTLDSLAAS